MKCEDKKILLISHNPLSRVNNNGKTLASIFEGVLKSNIYQIYLNSDIPDYYDDCHYLQLNEKQIFGSLIGGKNVCCQEVKSIPGKVSSATIRRGTFGIYTKRLLRECVWKITFWKTRLKEWLKDKQFDVVFFMAGDGMFAYDIYRFVMQHISAKGCLFFTDDYILGRSSCSPVALLRQSMLKQKIKNVLPITKELYVISDEMKEAYTKLFHIEAYVVRNFSVEKVSSGINQEVVAPNKEIIMIYAGGLHYNRWQVLSQIANAIKDFNASNEIKYQLKIYSSQNVSGDIIKEICLDGASEFCGKATASQIAGIYAGADILLHVESFDKKAIASTKYSFSTKIPEYLSAGKCILAVGPKDVASIQYLAKVACTVKNIKEISNTLQDLSDNTYREIIKSKCEEQYEKDFSEKKHEECLEHILKIL